mgnify:FL=1
MSKGLLINTISILILTVLIIGCSSDDDGGGGGINLRDPQEVWTEDSLEIRNFLANYTYSLEQNPVNSNLQTIVYDSIGESNSDATPIIDSPLLETVEIEQDGVDYQMFLLKIREGASDQRHPKETDSTLVTFRAKTIENELFNSSPNAAWFDLANEIRGYRLGLSELRGSTGFTENSDGTITFNDDFGFAAVFIPSGLGFFGTPPVGTGLGAYQPLIVDFQLYKSVLADHDQDLIPTYLEDLDGDGLVRDHDTDRNGTPNYLDVDDDGDGTPTFEEVFIDDNGELQTPDTNGNGTPDYLDPEFP